jgi:hypothetical protein
MRIFYLLLTWQLFAACAFIAFDVQAQNVGIGVSNPQSKLTVNGNVAIGTGFNGVAPGNGAAVQGPLFVGGTLSNMTSYPDSGAGTYMFFDPINGSLYAGNVTGPSWDGANRGPDNAVFGQNNLVSGGYNLVDGAANTVAGNGNVVGGYSQTITITNGNPDTAHTNLVTGFQNSITTSNADWVGGSQCSITTSDNSCAFGQTAVISNCPGTFVFSDGSATTSPTTFHQFIVRAQNGTTFYSSTGSTGVSLAAGASSWSALSDVRAKENVRDLGYGLNAVLAMRPLIYNYKGNSPAQKAIGFIAQDVRKVVPEIVDVPKDPAAMMGIRYSELIPVLAKAIQELKQEKDGQIEKLKNEVAQLKAANEKLATLAADMEALKKVVATLQEKENVGVRTEALKR